MAVIGVPFGTVITGPVGPFAESNCEQRSERWVSLELEAIVLDCASEFAGNKSACRSRYRPIRQAVQANQCPAHFPLQGLSGGQASLRMRRESSAMSRRFSQVGGGLRKK